MKISIHALAEQFPDDKHSYYFQGIAAVRDEDWRRAETALLKARELGIPEESVAVWLKTAIDNQRSVWQYAWILLWVTIGWLAGLAVLYGPPRLQRGAVGAFAPSRSSVMSTSGANISRSGRPAANPGQHPPMVQHVSPDYSWSRK